MVNPNIEKLQMLRLHGMVKSLDEQMKLADIDSLTFDERLALMVDREYTERENKRLTSRLKKAKLKQPACIENIDFKCPRGLDKSLVVNLASCKWIKEHRNILMVGPTGTGKTFLACALANKACLEGFNALYVRMPRLLPDLIVAKGDGSYAKKMQTIAKADVLILDDWGLLTLNPDHRRDLLEILDDRHDKSSTIVTSQIPIKLWHEAINDNTLADAILDRLIHNAYRIELKGESMRKMKSPLTTK